MEVVPFLVMIYGEMMVMVETSRNFTKLIMFLLILTSMNMLRKELFTDTNIEPET